MKYQHLKTAVLCRFAVGTNQGCELFLDWDRHFLPHIVLCRGWQALHFVCNFFLLSNILVLDISSLCHLCAALPGSLLSYWHEESTVGNAALLKAWGEFYLESWKQWAPSYIQCNFPLQWHFERVLACWVKQQIATVGKASRLTPKGAFDPHKCFQIRG